MKQKALLNPHLIQKKFYDHIKKKALSLETGQSREMRTYFQGQQKYLKRNFAVASAKSLFNSVEKSQVIFIGDFHTFDQSGRNLERLIRFMLDERSHKKNITLGMEMVMHKSQFHVDNFLSGLISEEELLESINYHDSWRFPWTHYRAFFQLAKQHGIKILALNSTGSLKQRDEKAAKLVSQQLEQDQNNKIFVLFGEAHIFPNKLPLKVLRHSQKLFKKNEPLEYTIIHQNLDDVFWKMPKKTSLQKKQDQIVSFSKNEYCLLTSPPWVKYESMVYWYENISDDPEFDLHSAHFEQGLKRFTENSHDTFVYLLEHLWAALLTNEARPSMTQLSDFNLYDSSKIDFLIGHGRKTRPSQKATQVYLEASLAKGRPFSIPGAFHYYSPSYSFNRLVLLAGIHLFTYRRGKGTLKNLIEKGPAEGRFAYFINMEMVSYYCSKIINPYRKCDLYKDLKRKERSPSTTAKKRALIKMTIKLLTTSPKSIQTTIAKKRPLILHDIARILGPLMAEMALEKFQIRNYQREELHHLLFNGDLNLHTFIRLREMCCGDIKKLKNGQKRFF